jgi:predicted transcriptional regulator
MKIFHVFLIHHLLPLNGTHANPMQSNTEIIPYLNESEYLQETIAQLEKDLSAFGISIHFSVVTNNIYEQLLTEISNALTPFLGTKTSSLYSILYRIDIPEKMVTETKKHFPEYSLGKQLAHCILVRELQKVISRKHFHL